MRERGREGREGGRGEGGREREEDEGRGTKRERLNVDKLIIIWQQ